MTNCTDLAMALRRAHQQNLRPEQSLVEGAVIPLLLSRIRNSLSYSITEQVPYDKLVKVTGIGERNLALGNGLAHPSTTFAPSYTLLPIRLPYVKYIEPELQSDCLRQKLEQYGQYAADQLDSRMLNIFMRRATLRECTDIVGATHGMALEKGWLRPTVISPYDGAPARGAVPVNIGGRWYAASTACPVIAEHISDDMLMTRYAYAFEAEFLPIMGAPLMLRITDLSWSDEALHFTLGYSCPRVYRTERMLCLREA
jgi:hypothetical protein